jgi:hypothetical protein
MGLDERADRFGEVLHGRSLQVDAREDLIAALVDHLALLVHHLVVLQHVLADLGVLLLDRVLRPLDRNTGDMRELANEILLKRCGRTGFGAIDREGSGTWSMNGNQLLLNGPPRPDKDFILVKSKSTKDKFITVKVNDASKVILRYVICSIKTDTGIIQDQTNEEGVVKFPKQPVESISLLHLLWPDRFSVFDMSDKELNDFEFTIDPAIMKVYFQNLTLTEDDGELTGQHPLMKGDGFTYEKSR